MNEILINICQVFHYGMEREGQGWMREQEMDIYRDIYLFIRLWIDRPPVYVKKQQLL